ncbi:uncharacterized protein [Acropora muricata]|uniref:uncharacterized protein isoform X2 n=1 Tax=Acropora muricata TaxID=159855 RepID=UPI0034E47560
MATGSEYTEEQLNYYRICCITTDELTDGLRTIFKQEWDNRYATTLGEWKDEAKNGQDFKNGESPRNQVRNQELLATMINGNRAEWDCSMLFYAILYSDCIGRGLNVVVRSNVDDLRKFRNQYFAHLPRGQISEPKFQSAIAKVQGVFQALGLSTVKIQEIRNQANFSISHLNKILKEVDKLKQEVKVLEDQLQSETTPFCILPPQPPHDVAARKDEVAKITEVLKQLKETNKSRLSYLFISGNPGSGKSQLAGLVAKQIFMESTHAFVMTLDAANLDRLLDSYVSFARHLKCSEYAVTYTLNDKDLKTEEKIAYIKSLAGCKVELYASWLLLVDNVVSMPEMNAHLPDTGNSCWSKGQLLITSQDTTSIPPDNSFIKHMSVSKGMAPSEAISLLATISGIADDENATKVAHELGPSWKTVDRVLNVPDAGSSVPAEIRGRGPEAERAFQKAMKSGKVKVYRARIMLLGQDRAGKTSLKKSLLGLPFDPKEESTVGVEVDRSKCELEVDEVQNWMPSERKKREMSEFEEELARLIVMDLRGTKANDNDSTATDSNVEEVKITDEVEERKDFEEPKLLSDVVTDTKEESMIVEDGQKAFPEQKPVDENNSNKLQLNINSTILPNDVTDLDASNATDLVVRYLRSLQLEDDIKSKEVILTVWDFAGQHLYYASHSVFLSGRAVYILVYNLNKNLLARAEPCVRQGVIESSLDNPNNETNLDNLLSWLVSVHNIRSSAKKNVAHQRKKPSYLQPPVIIVGTNLDQPFEEVNTMEERIKKSIVDKKYMKHVTAPFFAVDNKTESDESVQTLRQRIIEILKEEPYMGEEVPLRWFKFERAVDALVAKQTYFMDLDQLLLVIRQFCQIEDKKEVTAMLNFYHDLGVIVKHGQTVVLQAQWLIDLFKQLITVRPFDEANPSYREHWRDLEVNGILRMALVDQVFSTFMDKGLCKQDILDLMERHGLIAKFSIATDKNQDEQRYFVPTQLRSSPSALCEIKPSGCDPCPLVLHFLDGFVPHGLFPQLVSKFIHWCSENGLKETPQLFDNGARLFIGKQITFALILVCRKRFIKIVLKTRNPSSCKSQPMNASNKMAIEVRNFIERTLEDFSRDLSWLSNLRYELSVVCTYCLECTCHLHERTSCDQDDCFHLLRVRPGEGLICLKNFCDETVSPGWEMWFEVPHTQTKEPEGDTQIADGYSSIVPPKRKKGVEENESAHPAGHSSRVPPKRQKGIEENESAHPAGHSSRVPPKKRKGIEVNETVQPADPNEVESFDSRTLSKDDVLLIAHELGPSWEMLGRVLNVPDDVIDQIEANKSKDSEKCYSILRRWQEMYRSDATYHALACALQHPAVDRDDLAVKYCGLQLGKDVAVAKDY